MVQITWRHEQFSREINCTPTAGNWLTNYSLKCGPIKMPPFGANWGVTKTLKSPTEKDRLRETVRREASLYSMAACLAVAQGVSRRPLKAKGRVRSQTNLREISGKQSGTGISFSPSTPLFPLSVLFFSKWCTVTHSSISEPGENEAPYVLLFQIQFNIPRKIQEKTSIIYLTSPISYLQEEVYPYTLT